MIDLEKIEIENFNTTVYFASEKILVLRRDPFVEILDRKTSKLINKILIKNLYNFKSCEYFGRILIVFDSNELLSINVDDGEAELYDINLGNVVTEIFVKDNYLIFGASIGGMFHYVIYDFEKKVRAYQTQSIRAATLSYHFGINFISSIMSNSQIIKYGYDATEIFKRFEYQYIIPGITEYRSKILYCSSNVLKFVNSDGQIESVEIPIIKINKLEKTIGNNLYCICGEKKNIGCINLDNNSIEYEIRANSIINKILISKGRTPSNKTTDILFFSTENSLEVIDLKAGKLLYQSTIPKIKEFKEYTSSDIIIRTHLGGSHIIKKHNNENRIIEL